MNPKMQKNTQKYTHTHTHKIHKNTQNTTTTITTPTNNKLKKQVPLYGKKD